ncbi:MAG: hypothetical protein JWQ04_1256, partial [Pedosphaera sp.]|nr:hypothetical protein [Pedosphaera sp.]
RTQAQPNFELENHPVFNVVIVYEDFAAGKHAKETYDYLVHQLGRDYEFNNQMWKFDVLGNAKMQEMAVKDAVLADLIIISTHGIGELPAEVSSWIEHWTIQKSRAMALVALVDRPADEIKNGPASINASLQSAARLAQISYFAQPNDWPDRDDDFSIQQISERAERTSTIMADFIHHHSPIVPSPAILAPRSAPARWGINE